MISSGRNLEGEIMDEHGSERLNGERALSSKGSLRLGSSGDLDGTVDPKRKKRREQSQRECSSRGGKRERYERSRSNREQTLSGEGADGRQGSLNRSSSGSSDRAEEQRKGGKSELRVLEEPRRTRTTHIVDETEAAETLALETAATEL